MTGRVVFWLALCGCNQILGLSPTHLAQPDAPPVEHVQPFVQHGNSSAMGKTDTFVAAAGAAGDAVVFLVGCNNGDYMNAPTALTVVGGAYSFQPIAAIRGIGGYWATAVGAIAPDADTATFGVHWTVATPCKEILEIGDEFHDNDATGGAATFDSSETSAGMGDCTTTITTNHAGDTIWGACFSTGYLTDVGATYTKGADDGGGEWSEFKQTNDAGGTVETVTFVNPPNDGYVIVATAIAPR